MKKTFIVAAAALFLALGVVSHAAEVTPAALELTCFRTTPSSGNVTTTEYYQGDDITFTNSIMYVGADTNSAVQELSNCVITVTMGNVGDTNVTVATGYTIVATSGTWGAEMAVPAFNPCYIEVSVSNTYLYTYPRYRIATKAKLGE